MLHKQCTFGDFLVGLSVLCVIYAFIGACGYDIYLASTQWMSVAALLALWGIYLKLAKTK